jgi:hypothetical protein
MHSPSRPLLNAQWLTKCCASISALLLFVVVTCPTVMAQKPKKPPRATPPVLDPGQYKGIFFEDATSQLVGDFPTATSATDGMAPAASTKPASGNTNGGESWKDLISGQSVEDLIKESITRLESFLSTPAKFANGGFTKAKREFTLIGILMGVTANYPEEIRWKSSASYSQQLITKMATECNGGATEIFKNATDRLKDLQSLLKGSKLSGNLGEIRWKETANREVGMELLEWALRENLAPATSSDKQFKDSQEDILKYSEWIAVYGYILQLETMPDADDEAYTPLAKEMMMAAQEIAKARVLQYGF